MSGPLWVHVDPDGDRVHLDTWEAGTVPPPGTLASLYVDGSTDTVWIDRAAALELRDALDRLLAGGAS